MSALVAGIHAYDAQGQKDVDGRDKPSHEDEMSVLRMRVGFRFLL